MAIEADAVYIVLEIKFDMQGMSDELMKLHLKPEWLDC